MWEDQQDDQGYFAAFVLFGGSSFRPDISIHKITRNRAKQTLQNLCWTGSGPLFIIVAPLPKAVLHLALASAASFQLAS